MPNVDGLESTRLIRQLGYTAPIVALTALNGDSNMKDCLDSGMNMFISKPIKRPALRKVLKTYCSTIVEEELTPKSEMPCSANSPFVPDSPATLQSAGSNPE